jgi:hypothetical protein
VPALVGPFVALALGAALAWLGRADASREDEESVRARVRVVALFAALVVAPAFGYFLLFAGDWSLFYLAESKRIPSALGLLLVMLDASLVVAGFALGHAAARRRAPRALVALVAAPAGVAAAMVAAFLPKLRVDGTYLQVTARFGTKPVAGSPLGFALVWMGAMLAAGLYVTARALSERPTPPPAPRAPEGPRPKQPLLGQRRRLGS